MGFLDKFTRKKNPDTFTLDVKSRRTDERMFTVRDIEITVEKLPADKGIAKVHFRGGTEQERSALAHLFDEMIVKDYSFRLESGSPNDHADYKHYSHPVDVSLTGFTPQEHEKPAVTFEALCHAAERIERQYKSRILE